MSEFFSFSRFSAATVPVWSSAGNMGSEDNQDLTTLFLKCVDYVRETAPPASSCLIENGGSDKGKKRSFQTYDMIPWGWAATKIMELLQAYPSGLTSVILR